ncbi:MAG TPA: tail fiber domain-containing protein [Terriglobales bacterium]|nr:tail fiber domain-containing protein [Terriglobales bacterium]
MKTNPFQNSVNRSSSPVVLILLTCFALFQRAEAVNPPPDGGYPGGNTAEGQNALLGLTTGTYNTGVGFSSLSVTTTGNFNTGMGAGTLLANTADQNTATGAGALLSNTTGAFNTANGAFALFTNTIGTSNTASGAFALLNNTTGVENTANGYRVLSGNATGVGNTAYGSQALVQSTGNNNIALGAHAGFNISTGSNNIHIGNVGAGNESATVRIGDNNQTKAFIAGINGVNQGSPTAVFINTLTGQLGTTAPASSRRYKKEIKPIDAASEAVLALKPVSFHYKSDNTKTPQFGLIAEDVADVDPDLVMRDENGEIYTVRYDAVNAMLLNEFLKEHHQVQDLKATVAEQHRRIEALTMGLQKVNAQLEASRPAQQVAVKDR